MFSLRKGFKPIMLEQKKTQRIQIHLIGFFCEILWWRWVVSQMQNQGFGAILETCDK